MDDLLKRYSSGLHILFLFMVCFAIVFLVEPVKSSFVETVGGNTVTKKDITIAIDPGHGGRDPGKVGVTGVKEKDINLQIALKVKERLEDNGFKVVMTRTEDVGLDVSSDNNKKGADLRRRVELINQSDATIAVSIHQNSFTQESVKGAQVFYYTSSKDGERLANILQDSLKSTLQDGNHRVAKSNDGYYMLKKTSIPIVIVECGYLSNYGESALLIKEEYQERLALAIEQGIYSYLEVESQSTFSVVAK